MANANKKPIEWHEQCLANEKLYVEECRKEAVRAADMHLGAQIGYEVYEKQIAKARAEGRASFDRNRFAKE
jgi:hypothetical protein